MKRGHPHGLHYHYHYHLLRDLSQGMKMKKGFHAGHGRMQTRVDEIEAERSRWPLSFDHKHSYIMDERFKQLKCKPVSPFLVSTFLKLVK